MVTAVVSKWNWPALLILVLLIGASAFVPNMVVSEKSSSNELNTDTIHASQLARRAELHSKSGRIDSAIMLYSSIAAIYRKHGLESDYAATLINLSEQFMMAGLFNEAQKYGEEASVLARRLNDRKLIARLSSIRGSLAANINNYDTALYFFWQAVEMGATEFEEKSYFISDCYGNIGICYLGKQDYSRALQYLNKAVDLFPVGKGIPEDNLVIFYFYLGSVHQNLSNYTEALRYYKMMLDYYYPKYGDGHPFMGSLYNNLAEIYRETGKLEDARIYMQRARMIFEAVRGKTDPLWIKATNNMAGILAKSGQYREALSLLFQVTNFFSSLEKPTFDFPLALNSIGHVYENMKIYDSSEYFYRRGIKAAGAIADHQELLCNIYSNLGVLYAKTNRFSSAVEVMNEAIRQFQTTGIRKHTVIARLYYNMGNIYNDYGQTEIALRYLQKSLVCNVRDFNDTNRFSNPSVTDVHNKDLLIKALTSKASALRFIYYGTGNRSSEFLKASFQSAYLAVQAIDSLRAESSGSLIELMNNEGLPYATGIENAYLLYHISGDKSYMDKAFEISEKSKYYTLYQSLNELNARNIGGIPDSLQDKERLMRIRIAAITKALEDEQLNPRPDPERVKRLEQKQFLMKVRSDSLVKIFEQDYPAYYRLKYDRKVAALEDVMKSLKPGHALVEYATGLDRVVIFVITPATSTMVSVAEIGLLSYVDKFRKVIRDRDISESGRTEYCSVAGHLYDRLLAPADPLVKGRHLIIIPDGKLGTIPFQALINTGKKEGLNSYNSLPYVARDYSIGYGYSSTLYLNSLSMKENRASKKELLAFAPSFGNNKVLLSELKERGTDFSDLEGARDEVLQIEKEYGGKVFLDSAATLQNFLQYSPEYNVLHISTHGILNDEKPLESKLVFYKKNDSTESDLYIHDLFTMKLNANLVVLSACNTGFGKVADGEGIISLSGAFLYTGVSSLISTLWSVNDRSTAAIMRSFYSSVFNKEDKPEALRMAQLNYLSTADNLLAHPYYWAGFIAIGNDQPLHVSNVSTIVAILLTLSGIVILILFFIKHRRSKTT